METVIQNSAGGVAYRVVNGSIEIAVISVGENNRWQLPKGRVDSPETVEAAAQREVREEAGLETDLIAPLEVIDYWFYTGLPGHRVRIHKFVSFFLLRFKAGDPKNHDHEVNEARWMGIETALQSLAFDTERSVVVKAHQMLSQINSG
jgi:8-oxo-dGTP diphosphatase